MFFYMISLVCYIYPILARFFFDLALTPAGKIADSLHRLAVPGCRIGLDAAFRRHWSLALRRLRDFCRLCGLRRLCGNMLGSSRRHRLLFDRTIQLTDLALQLLDLGTDALQLGVGLLALLANNGLLNRVSTGIDWANAVPQNVEVLEKGVSAPFQHRNPELLKQLIIGICCLKHIQKVAAGSVFELRDLELLRSLPGGRRHDTIWESNRLYASKLNC